MTIIVMIEATPDKAPVKAYNLHPCKYTHYQKWILYYYYSPRGPHIQYLCVKTLRMTGGAWTKVSYFYQHELFKLT